MRKLILLLIILFYGCSIKVSKNYINIDKIIESRKDAIISASKLQPTDEYDFFHKNNKRVLKSLMKEMGKKNLTINSKIINIIECFEIESKEYQGVLWVENKFIMYKYDIKSKKIKILHDFKDFEQYPVSSTIYKSTIEFLRTNEDKPFDIASIPTIGISNGGYCIYTKYNGSGTLNSYAFRQ